MVQSVHAEHLECFHFTANHTKSRLLCMEIKIRFDYSLMRLVRIKIKLMCSQKRMRIWPNIVWSASKMPPFHGNCSKIKTISHKNESQVFTKTPANTAQYWQMFQNQDYFAWKLNSCCRKNAGEYGPILDEAHLECCHFTAKDPESRLFRMKIKVRFHHSLMRIWPDVERNASRLYFAANHTEPRLFRMEMKVRFDYSRMGIWSRTVWNAATISTLSRGMIQNQDQFAWKWN